VTGLVSGLCATIGCDGLLAAHQVDGTLFDLLIATVDVVIAGDHRRRQQGVGFGKCLHGQLERTPGAVPHVAHLFLEGSEVVVEAGPDLDRRGRDLGQGGGGTSVEPNHAGYHSRNDGAGGRIKGPSTATAALPAQPW
jgi:hypothetical protein